MKVSYFPGCTLKNKARDLDDYARKSAEILGITLEEIPDWQCCGGVFTTAKNEIATKLSSVRALKYAAEKEQPLVSVCSACHKVNNYMAEETPYNGEAQVYHYLEMLRDLVGFDTLKEKVVNALSGKKIAAYYGCLLLRPSGVMQMDDPENPKILENFIKAIGATPVVYAMRNECCGGYISLESPELANKKSNAVIENAKAQGAEMIITACPLCKYNLIKNGADIPVVYFTELLAEALGVKEDTNE